MIDYEDKALDGIAKADQETSQMGKGQFAWWTLAKAAIYAILEIAAAIRHSR